MNSPSKIEGVARRAGGVCHPSPLPPRRITHSSALTGTSPSLGEDLNSPSKIEGVARRAGGVCHPATLAATQE